MKKAEQIICRARSNRLQRARVRRKREAVAAAEGYLDLDRGASGGGAEGAG